MNLFDFIVPILILVTLISFDIIALIMLMNPLKMKDLKVVLFHSTNSLAFWKKKKDSLMLINMVNS